MGDVIRRPHTLGQVSWEVTMIEDYLEPFPIGTVVTYEDLGRIARLDPVLDMAKLKRYVSSARRRLKRDKQIVYDVAPKIGIKRLADEETAKLGEGYRRRAVGAAKRGIETNRCIDLNRVSSGTQNYVIATTAMFLAIGTMAAKKTLKFIERTRHIPQIPTVSEESIKKMFRGA